MRTVLGIGHRQSALRRDAGLHGPGDRRTVGLLRLLFRYQHRPRHRLRQFLYALEVLRPDLRRDRTDSAASALSRRRGRSLLRQTPPATRHRTHQSRYAGPRSIRPGPFRSRPPLRHLLRRTGLRPADPQRFGRILRRALYGRKLFRRLQRTHRRSGTDGDRGDRRTAAVERRPDPSRISGTRDPPPYDRIAYSRPSGSDGCSFRAAIPIFSVCRSWQRRWAAISEPV